MYNLFLKYIVKTAYVLITIFIKLMSKKNII